MFHVKQNKINKIKKVLIETLIQIKNVKKINDEYKNVK